MSTSGLIETILGLAFIYLFLSLVCTSIVEWISALSSKRAQLLKYSLGQLVGTSLRDKVYEDPLIRDLTAKSKPTIAFSFLKQNPGLPSYIPSRQFVLALLRAMEAFPNYREIGANQPIPPIPTFATTRDNLFTKMKEENDPQNLEIYHTILTVFSNVADNPAGVTGQLIPIAIGGQTDLQLENAVKRLEAWFDTAMNRLSGVYRRETERRIIWIAFVLCLILNADTFRMARLLWNGPNNLRAAMSINVEQVIKAQPTTAQPGVVAEIIAKKVSEQVASQPNPLGWEPEKWNPSVTNPKTFFCAIPIHSHRVLPKLIGLAVTVCLVSLGAPFWFDTLNRFSRIRLTGSKPMPGTPSPPTSTTTP